MKDDLTGTYLFRLGRLGTLPAAVPVGATDGAFASGAEIKGLTPPTTPPAPPASLAAPAGFDAGAWARAGAASSHL